MRTFLLTLALFSVGCSNPWKSSFQPNPGLAGEKFSPTDSVQIRTVEFERLQRYSESERQMRVNSTTAPQDLPPEQITAAKNRLLEALQMRERGDEVELLGYSEFASNERLDPHDS